MRTYRTPPKELNNLKAQIAELEAQLAHKDKVIEELAKEIKRANPNERTRARIIEDAEVKARESE